MVRSRSRLPLGISVVVAFSLPVAQRLVTLGPLALRVDDSADGEGPSHGTTDECQE